MTFDKDKCYRENNGFSPIGTCALWVWLLYGPFYPFRMRFALAIYLYAFHMLSYGPPYLMLYQVL